jgi:hypothetical protein
VVQGSGGEYLVGAGSGLADRLAFRLTVLRTLATALIDRVVSVNACLQQLTEKRLAIRNGS